MAPSSLRLGSRLLPSKRAGGSAGGGGFCPVPSLTHPRLWPARGAEQNVTAVPETELQSYWSPLPPPPPDPSAPPLTASRSSGRNPAKEEGKD